MNRFLTFLGMVALSVFFLSTSVTPGEACWLSRKRCGVTCSPSGCQQLGDTCGLERTSTLCLYCDGAFWRQAVGNQTCVNLPASMKDTRCNTKIDHGATLKGYDFHYNFVTGKFDWYSNMSSSAYCDVSYRWSSGCVISATRKERCANGVWSWDIQVSD
jgi:hypothetical protein